MEVHRLGPAEVYRSVGRTVHAERRTRSTHAAGSVNPTAGDVEFSLASFLERRVAEKFSLTVDRRTQDSTRRQPSRGADENGSPSGPADLVRFLEDQQKQYFAHIQGDPTKSSATIHGGMLSIVEAVRSIEEMMGSIESRTKLLKGIGSPSHRQYIVSLLENPM